MFELLLASLCIIPSAAGSFLIIMGRKRLDNALAPMGCAIGDLESRMSAWTLLSRFPGTPALSGAIGAAVTLKLGVPPGLFGLTSPFAALFAAISLGAGGLAAGLGIFFVLNGVKREPAPWIKLPHIFGFTAISPTIVIPAALGFGFFCLTAARKTWIDLPWTSLPCFKSFLIFFFGVIVYLAVIGFAMNRNPRWNPYRRCLVIGMADFALLAPTVAAFYFLVHA